MVRAVQGEFLGMKVPRHSVQAVGLGRPRPGLSGYWIRVPSRYYPQVRMGSVLRPRIGCRVGTADPLSHK